MVTPRRLALCVEIQRYVLSDPSSLDFIIPSILSSSSCARCRSCPSVVLSGPGISIGFAVCEVFFCCGLQLLRVRQLLLRIELLLEVASGVLVCAGLGRDSQLCSSRMCAQCVLRGPTPTRLEFDAVCPIATRVSQCLSSRPTRADTAQSHVRPHQHRPPLPTPLQCTHLCSSCSRRFRIALRIVLPQCPRRSTYCALRRIRSRGNRGLRRRRGG